MLEDSRNFEGKPIGMSWKIRKFEGNQRHMNSKEIDRNEWENTYESVGNTTGIVWKIIGNQVGKP